MLAWGPERFGYGIPGAPCPHSRPSPKDPLTFHPVAKLLMRTSTRKVALLLFDGVDLLDLAAPVQALSLVGRDWNWRAFTVLPVAESVGIVATDNQIQVEATVAAQDVEPADIILVPGGYGVHSVPQQGSLLEWLRQNGPRASWVGGIGQGRILLANAGLLENCPVACPSHERETLETADASAVTKAQRVVPTSTNIITSQAGTAGLDLALHIIAETVGAKQADSVAAALGHHRTVYFAGTTDAPPRPVALPHTRPSLPKP